MSVSLCPAQQDAFDSATRLLPAGNLFVVYGETGCGRTTVLEGVHRETGGAFLTLHDLVEALSARLPMQIEETLHRLLTEALSSNDVVVLDDLHLVNNVVGECRHFYPRCGLIDAVLSTIATCAIGAGKKLIFGSKGAAPEPVALRCFYAGIPEFKPVDYEAICRSYLDQPLRTSDECLAGAAAKKPNPESFEPSASIDYKKLHRFAPRLNAHQLQLACAWLKLHGQIDTQTFITYLRTKRLGSNVDLGEVQEVDLHSLRGIDDVIESLEANILVPLERDDLAAELNIKAKRGVLLAGPPGTGKTTIGRALAHRLKGKFFLVDGTLISGTRGFYPGIQRVFEAAKQNSPSIIFIDDSDVIFESGEELGLYRYLLTMLDGLESESASRICVMMTAMDVSNLPPALIRSGRIELWLQTRLPELEARKSILAEQIPHLPGSVGIVDTAQLAEAAEGLTGADLKRLVEDGVILIAYDRARNRALGPATGYFLAALDTVRTNKRRYAEAEERARLQRPSRPSFFDIMGQYTGGKDE